MTTLNKLLPVRRVESQVEQLSPAIDTAFLLPSAANILGKIYTFVNSGTAKILVQSSAGNLVRTIYPGTTGQVTPNIDFPTTAAHWEGIGVVQSNETSYTPTSNVSTNLSVLTGTWFRNGKNMNCKVHCRFTGASSGLLHFSLADSLVYSSIDTAVMYFTNAYVGIVSNGFERNGSSGTNTFGMAELDSSLVNTPITFNRHGDNNVYNTANTVSATEIHLAFTIPITAWSTTKG